MWTLYLLGNLLGRILFCYLLVLVVTCLGSKLEWRRGFDLTHRASGLIAIGILLVAGLVGSIAKNFT